MHPPVERFDVAVIGGGVIGLSVAREVARAGGGRVAVLERLPAVGHGSSARANGGVRAQFTTAVNVAFSLHSIEEYERLASNPANHEELGLRQVGYLLFTADPARLDALHAAYQLQRSMGVATEWLSPGDVLRHAPFLRPDGLLGGTFHERDGLIDPHGVVSVLVREARLLGVQIVTSAEVTAIRRKEEGFAVTTARGRLDATRLVNAAGPDAARVAALVGAEVPVEPVRRNLAFVEAAGSTTIAAPIPMCVDLDTGVLVRRDGSSGFVIAYSDPNDPPTWETTLDPAFLPALAERIGNRFPFLAHLRTDPARCWAGLYPETPDHHAIIGSSPGVSGFIHCAGFGGHGIMHAPAAGTAIAELITLGRCESFDLRPLRPSRFAEGELVREGAIF